MKRGWTLGAAVMLVLVAACVAGESSPAAEDDETTTATAVFAVQGMTCGGCEAGVEMKVRKLTGVEAVEASYDAGRATVTYAPDRVGPEAIVQAIEELGYSAELVEGEAEAAASVGPSERRS